MGERRRSFVFLCFSLANTLRSLCSNRFPIMTLLFLSTPWKTRGFVILPLTTSTLRSKRTSHARIFRQHAAAPVTTPPLPSPPTATTTTTALSATRKTTQTTLESQPTTELMDIYSINCPPTDPTVLHSVVTKHRETLDKFLTNKPIAAHTRDAFQQTKDSIQDFLSTREIDHNNESPGIILDR